MSAGRIIETGTVNGIPYRVWRRNCDGRLYVYTSPDNTRHNARWLRKQKEAEQRAKQTPAPLT